MKTLKQIRIEKVVNSYLQTLQVKMEEVDGFILDCQSGLKITKHAIIKFNAINNQTIIILNKIVELDKVSCIVSNERIDELINYRNNRNNFFNN